jgi:hypothetical protein
MTLALESQTQVAPQLTFTVHQPFGSRSQENALLAQMVTDTALPMWHAGDIFPLTFQERVRSQLFCSHFCIRAVICPLTRIIARVLFVCKPASPSSLLAFPRRHWVLPAYGNTVGLDQCSNTRPWVHQHKNPDQSPTRLTHHLRTDNQFMI